VRGECPGNRSGQPALSIPAASVDGLPHGVQLVGRHGEDALLLQLAVALEATSVAPRWPLIASLPPSRKDS
jgi:Asp-tRNA(Asn)/Glu-tRNA(Gln) amidotransferase A subunit family amidase